MPRRPRTAKKLAQRIELSYFERPHPLRRWRFILSVAVPAIALLWLAVVRVSGNRTPYSMGHVSASHAFFGQKCSACHVADAVSFRHPVSDQACLACHDGPIHQAAQTFTPSCSSCHVEHLGHVRLLAAVSDASCTQCHANLSTTAGASHFVRTVLSFAAHPEFAPLRGNSRDPGTIKFNHSVHLQTNLIGPDGRRVQLACNDCHRPGAGRGLWPYGAPGIEAVTFSGGAEFTPASSALHRSSAAEKRSELAYMAPPTYANTCFSCHALEFDSRFSQSVRHDTPTKVDAFLRAQYQQYASSHPSALRETFSPPRLPEQPVTQTPRVLTRDQWVADQTAAAENLLWRKTCSECHTLTFSSQNALPAIAPSRITVRWLPNSFFSHDAHRMVYCESCHSGIPASRLTADVNLPSVHTCQQCHAQRASAAPAGCYECHTYHDWSHEKIYPGKFSLPDLLKDSRNFSPAAAPATATVLR